MFLTKEIRGTLFISMVLVHFAFWSPEPLLKRKQNLRFIKSSWSFLFFKALFMHIFIKYITCEIFDIFPFQQRNQGCYLVSSLETLYPKGENHHTLLLIAHWRCSYPLKCAFVHCKSVYFVFHRYGTVFVIVKPRGYGNITLPCQISPIHLYCMAFA